MVCELFATVKPAQKPASHCFAMALRLLKFLEREPGAVDWSGREYLEQFVAQYPAGNVSASSSLPRI